MNLRLVALAFLAGGAVGSLVTAVALRGRHENAAPAGESSPATGDAGLHARLEAAEKKAREAEEALAAAAGVPAADPARPAPADPADTAARLAELRTWILTHRDNRDGRALIKLMHEFTALGPAGWESAMEIALLLESPQAYGLDWGDVADVYRGHDPAFLKWALSDPAHAPSLFRTNCVSYLENASSEDLRPFFADLLRREKDGTLTHALALGLLYDETPEMAPQLEELARIQAADSSTVEVLMHSLSRTGEAGEKALERLAADTDPVLSEEARVALAGARTTVKGWLVTTVPEGPVRRGDVLVSIDGAPALSADQVEKTFEDAAGDATFTVVVRRGGMEVKLTVGKGEAPEYGRMVTPGGKE